MQPVLAASATQPGAATHTLRTLVAALLSLAALSTPASAARNAAAAGSGPDPRQLLP